MPYGPPTPANFIHHLESIICEVLLASQMNKKSLSQNYPFTYGPGRLSNSTENWKPLQLQLQC